MTHWVLAILRLPLKGILSYCYPIARINARFSGVSLTAL